MNPLAVVRALTMTNAYIKSLAKRNNASSGTFLIPSLLIAMQNMDKNVRSTALDCISTMQRTLDDDTSDSSMTIPIGFYGDDARAHSVSLDASHAHTLLSAISQAKEEIIADPKYIKNAPRVDLKCPMAVPSLSW